MSRTLDARALVTPYGDDEETAAPESAGSDDSDTEERQGSG